MPNSGPSRESRVFYSIFLTMILSQFDKIVVHHLYDNSNKYFWAIKIICNKRFLQDCFSKRMVGGSRGGGGSKQSADFNKINVLSQK